jgi:hypothetical protein
MQPHTAKPKRNAASLRTSTQQTAHGQHPFLMRHVLSQIYASITHLVLLQSACYLAAHVLCIAWLPVLHSMLRQSGKTLSQDSTALE